MQQWLKEVARGKRGSKNLSYQETREVANSIITGEATDAQIAAYLVALRLKTESPEELLAFVHMFEEHTTKGSSPEGTIDFAGPYTGRNSFAATIPSAILLANYGIPTFLHSSDTLPPKYGVSIKEILRNLGVYGSTQKEDIATSLNEIGQAFAWTEGYCSSLAKLRPIREQIGVRTLLNTVEKLLNISNSNSVMMGAFHRTAIEKIHPIFKDLSFKKVYIVQGLEGSEDLPVHRNSFIYSLTGDSLDSFIVKPADYGVLNKDFDKTKKLSAKEQRKIIVSILSGEKVREYEYYYQQVLFNTGIRYYLFGAAPTIEAGIEIAKDQLENFNGIKQLEKWKEGYTLK
ncbi:anthranilate phosphoribosyltransferase [Aquibacillus salsiterrae]|uniref:Anthranilate phosphoribosyltransferase n=1 Tax=Aquibacillus salsiterrae TaxID=2950439 RepID=A0A9X3WIA9_9BACI|nr:anthranilate phosphoribosyltransferase [Aquibacillus salsiterrae]MDC3417974.1 anthranilate phosphoribosyltransferase [Aquibacillus salsiterrae]